MFFKRFRAATASKEPYGLPEGLRVYAIGDIHGRHDLLLRLLALIDADRAGHPDARLIFLGDYIDRGTESRAVLDRLMDLQATQQAACLRGNHEAMLLGALDGQLDWDFWLSNGGVETLFSYGLSVRDFSGSERDERLRQAVRAAVPPAHLDFLAGLPLSTGIGGYFFCHAGLRPGVPLDRQSPQDLMWIRDAFIQSTADHGARVVHGHTPVMEVDVRPNRINVDTGAYLTNRLSCVALEGTEERILHT